MASIFQGFVFADFRKDDLVLFGSYFAINPRIRSYVRSLLDKAHNAGAVIFYDINFRKNHQRDLADTFKNIEENCRLSDFVRGSSEDFGYLFGITDPQEIYEGNIKPLCSNFICTQGVGPVEIFTGSKHLTFPVEDFDTVSTIGAGDNFNAGFLFSLLAQNICKDGISDLSDEDWGTLVETAGRFSKNVCQSIFNYVDEDFCNLSVLR